MQFDRGVEREIGSFTLVLVSAQQGLLVFQPQFQKTRLVVVFMTDFDVTRCSGPLNILTSMRWLTSTKSILLLDARGTLLFGDHISFQHQAKG